MAVASFTSPRELTPWVGREVVATDWLAVTQEQIDNFAALTRDDQWIHVDPDRAVRESPFGATVAHGFLTLSLLSYFLLHSITIQSGTRAVINYGLNRVRFPAGVPVGSRLRARFTLQSLDETGDCFETTWSVVVERQGSHKPCCVAEWLVRYYP